MNLFHPSRHQATLTILLGGALLLVTALGAQIALHGITERYSTLVDTRIASLNQLHHIDTLFKRQVQEWKNTLLRGHDPNQRDMYWQSFLSTEAEVSKALDELESKALNPATRKALHQFQRSHKDLAKRYRQGFDIFLQSNLDFKAVDSLLRGIDRQPANQLHDFTERLERDIGLEADALHDTAGNYYIATLFIVIFASLVVAIGVAAIVRNAIKVEVDSHSRTGFLAKMSHEIRTPMNGVLGMSELLGATPLTEQQVRYNQAIHSSGQSLLILINDLLDYSRIEAGKMSLEHIPYSLRGLLSNLFYLFVHTAAEKQLKWHIDIAPEIPDQFMGDSVRLNQILVNLVGNALKFTKVGGVELTIRCQGGRLCFSCVDTGIGMTEQAISQLFTPFTQADTSINRRFGGTGLGLTISRELCLQMQGELRVKSAPEQGSEFIVDIPAELAEREQDIDFPAPKPRIQLCIEDPKRMHDYQRYCQFWGLQTEQLDTDKPSFSAARESAEPIIAVIDLSDHAKSDALATQCKQAGHKALQLYDVGQSNEWVNSHGEVSSGFKDRPPFGALLKPLLLDCLHLDSTKAKQHDPHTGIRPLNILAADDNSVNRTVVSAMLAKLGHRCTLACDGEDAVSQFINNSRPFDLVLMDCEMPVLDGVGALKCIREIEAQQQATRTPVLALTANAYQSQLDGYREAGMDDVLTKPLSLNTLKEALAKHAL
ncbi:ATP-binding protein [Simiduia curdlanivorans]|uniref:histidine kinase n=1 Tax=Simiduia curdlanivorans TaxID=1492769 RepID=A0ABV8V5Q3_9GAMM|nr:ATP-binding protein [Simiduia curdlanivorans]MDN3638601.1 ATP-binding protein [Simiduia curdlanivorans]